MSSPYFLNCLKRAIESLCCNAPVLGRGQGKDDGLFGCCPINKECFDGTQEIQITSSGFWFFSTYFYAL